MTPVLVSTMTLSVPLMMRCMVLATRSASPGSITAGYRLPAGLLQVNEYFPTLPNRTTAA